MKKLLARKETISFFFDKDELDSVLCINWNEALKELRFMKESLVEALRNKIKDSLLTFGFGHKHSYALWTHRHKLMKLR